MYENTKTYIAKQTQFKLTADNATTDGVQFYKSVLKLKIYIYTSLNCYLPLDS